MTKAIKPLSDRLLDRLKNKRWFAYFFVFSVVLGSAISFTDGLTKLYNYWNSQFSSSSRLDIVGNWDKPKAWSVSKKFLESASQLKPNPFCDEGLEEICSPVHFLINHYYLKYKNKELMLLAVETSGTEGYSHAAAPYLSFFEFEKRQNGWLLTNKEIAVIKKGSWGVFIAPHLYERDVMFIDLEASHSEREISSEEVELSDDKNKLSVVVIGNDVYGIFLKSDTMHQGIWGGSTAVYAKVGDSLKEVLHIFTSENNDGSGDPDRDSKWYSTIEIEGGTTGFYDIVVKSEGTEGGEKFKKTERYKFNGDKYIANPLSQKLIDPEDL